MRAHPRPHWLEDVQLLGNFRLIGSDSPPVILNSQLDQAQTSVLIHTAWRPRLDARLRVRRAGGGGGGSFDVILVSMEVTATLRLGLGSQPSGLKLSEPVGLDVFLTAHSSPGETTMGLACFLTSVSGEVVA